jgi:hypothetical protein
LTHGRADPDEFPHLAGNPAFPDEPDTQRLFGVRVTDFYSRWLTGRIPNLEGHHSRSAEWGVDV